MKNNILISFVLIFSLNIFSCSPAGILASGGATGMVVAEGDRSLGTVVDDATIKLNIAAKFISSDDNLFVDISDPEHPKYVGVDFGIMGTLNPADQHYIAKNL